MPEKEPVGREARAGFWSAPSILLVVALLFFLVVIVRTDPHATYDDAAAAHPDWIAVQASGQPRETCSG